MQPILGQCHFTQNGPHKFRAGQGLEIILSYKEPALERLKSNFLKVTQLEQILPEFKPKPAHALQNHYFLQLIATKSFYSQVLNIDRCECKAPLCAPVPLAFGRRPLYESAQCISCQTPQELYIWLLPCECPSPSPLACSHQRQEHDNVGKLTQRVWPCCHSHIGAHGTSWPM